MSRAWADDYYWPRESDSKELLQEKVSRNTNAAWGEIAVDIVAPGPDSDVTEYQSNAWVAKEYIDRKNKDKK